MMLRKIYQKIKPVNIRIEKIEKEYKINPARANINRKSKKRYEKGQ